MRLCGIIALWFALAMIAAAGSAQTRASGSADQDSNKISDRMPQIIECFDEAMREHSRKDETYSQYKYTIHTEIFIVDIIDKNIDRAIKLPPDEFCMDFLVNPYKDRYRKTVSSRRKEWDGSLAPPGGEPIESDSIFIELAHNLWLRHDMGHSDITARALADLVPDVAFAPNAIKFISRSSQVPDLYMWTNEAAHAHTPDYPSGQPPQVRSEKIAEGIRSLKSFIEVTISKARTKINVGDISAGLLYIGVACHAAQDLAYHRGITLRQHSGLAYIDGYVNPDFPPGSETAPFPEGSEAYGRFEQAKRFTVDLIRAIIGSLSEAGQYRVVKWEENTYEDYELFYDLVASVLGDEDIGYGELLKYRSLKSAYENGERSLDELTPEPSGSLVQWDVEAIMTDVVQSLERGG